MFKKQKPCFEKIDGRPHPDYESRNTRVSEYLRKYGTGKLDNLPRDTRPVVNDERSPDEMMNDEFVDTMATDELDVMQQLDAAKERFEKMADTIRQTKTNRVKFDNAMKVLNDPNSSYESRKDAYRILDELEQKNVVTRARN